MIRRSARILPLAGAVLLVAATPAGADPAKPTDYRSDITAIEPALPAGVTAQIVGGDSFLEVSVDAGHTVEVEGYEGEPYLRFLEDGTVQQNQRSTATYLNEDRYGQIDVPSSADNGAEPEWRTVDDDGEHAWHDHRIHYMSPDLPEDVERGDLVLTNEVALVVDGTPTVISIDVVLEPAQSPLPWIGLGLVAAAVALVVGWRRRPLLVALVAAGIGTGSAVVVGQGELSSVPRGTGESPLVLIVPVVGLAATVLAAVLLARKKAALAGVALLAGAAALAGWALLRLSVLSKPVLPTELPADLDRAGTTIAVAAAVAAAALTLHSGVVTPAPLTDDD